MQWIKARLRAWLGIADADEMIAGQRRDFETVLDAHEKLLRATVAQLNRTTKAALSANDRVNTYERAVPAIAKVKRAVDTRALQLVKASKQNGNGTHAPEEPNASA